MRALALTHRSDGSLLRHLSALVAQDRRLTASVLAHLAEVDARRLYLPAGYPSMFAYCVEELHFSEDAAYKRIQAGRAARQFPVLFTALTEGRLHLAAICLLAPHLTCENAEELVAACTHRPKAEIERWLGDRFEFPRTPEPILTPPNLFPPNLPRGKLVSSRSRCRLLPHGSRCESFSTTRSCNTPGSY